MLADYKFLKTITVLGIGRVGIYLKVEEDYLGVDMLDFQDNKEIVQQLDEGNIWAYAIVTILAMVENITEVFGTDTLGGCNYYDEQQFLLDGYYSDMESAAIEDLSTKLKDLKERLAQLE